MSAEQNEALGHTGDPVAWRYRYKPGAFKATSGKWTVQKNKPEWLKPDQTDVELEPLYAHPAPAQDEKCASDELVRELVEALHEAREDLEFWGAYASDYFKEKHGLEDCISKIDTVLRKYVEDGVRKAGAL